MYKYIKRFFDLVFAIILIIAISPFFIPIIILLRITDEGEVWYKQKRIGYKNEYFKIWKFATMLKNSPNIGTGSLTVRNDPRVTKIGKYLRKSKINELPQLINVLTSEMSFVGPRPQMEVDFNAYSNEVKKKIYDAKPGITGIGSIIFRDEEKFLSETELEPKQFYSEKIAPYKGELEMWYQKNQSFITDFKILCLTLWVIIFPESDMTYKVFKSLPKKSF